MHPHYLTTLVSFEGDILKPRPIVLGIGIFTFIFSVFNVTQVKDILRIRNNYLTCSYNNPVYSINILSPLDILTYSVYLVLSEMVSEALQSKLHT